MPTNVIVPPGCWPARMPPEMAAGYVGERSVEDFLDRVGTEYPPPVLDEGRGASRRCFWLKADLDRSIGNCTRPNISQLAVTEIGRVKAASKFVPSVMSPSMLAKRWLCSERHIRNMIKRGQLPAFSSGGKLLRIKIADVEAFELGEGGIEDAV
jgi:excisionase family DNA binding protein